MPTRTIARVPTKNNAARTPAALYVQSRARRTLLLVAVGLDHFLAFFAGLALPFREHDVADATQVGRQLVGRLDDGHAVLLELLDVPAVLLLGKLPAARLGVRRRLEQRLLRRLVERVERLH